MKRLLIRIFAVIIVVLVLAWLGAKFSDEKAELGSLRYSDSVQKESIDTLIEDKNRTDDVLADREEIKEKTNASSKEAVKNIYEAQSSEMDFDQPLPLSLSEPLRLQYQAISTRGEGGKGTPAQGFDHGEDDSGTP